MGVLGDVACVRPAGWAALGLGLRAEREGEGGWDPGGPARGWGGCGAVRLQFPGALGMPPPGSPHICCVTHLEARPLVTHRPGGRDTGGSRAVVGTSQGLVPQAPGAHLRYCGGAATAGSLPRGSWRGALSAEWGCLWAPTGSAPLPPGFVGQF